MKIFVFFGLMILLKSKSIRQKWSLWRFNSWTTWPYIYDRPYASFVDNTRSTI